MCELHADWGLGVGCRRPPDLEIHSAIPDYPFLVTGHASLDYGTVVVFCKPVMRNWCQWLPHISHSARTAWVHLHERGSGHVCMCLHEPPVEWKNGVKWWTNISGSGILQLLNLVPKMDVHI